MYKYGAEWTGTDISENQINEAKELANEAGMNIDFYTCDAKDEGSFLILYMGWLPFEDEIAGKSEELILKYNPKWTGCGDTVHPVWVPEEYLDYFKIEKQEEFRVDIPFTRDSWNGRMNM